MKAAFMNCIVDTTLTNGSPRLYGRTSGVHVECCMSESLRALLTIVLKKHAPQSFIAPAGVEKKLLILGTLKYKYSNSFRFHPRILYTQDVNA